jgi:hypothetical protein
MQVKVVPDRNSSSPQRAKSDGLGHSGSKASCCINHTGHINSKWLGASAKKLNNSTFLVLREVRGQTKESFAENVWATSSFALLS